MNKEAMVNMLLSMRAQIDAMLFLLDSDYQGFQERDRKAEQPSCTHRNRLNLTTMGGPIQWICKDCNHEHTEVEE